MVKDRLGLDRKFTTKGNLIFIGLLICSTLSLGFNHFGLGLTIALIAGGILLFLMKKPIGWNHMTIEKKSVSVWES